MTRNFYRLLTLVCLVLTSGCNLVIGQALVGSGVSMTESREIDAFTGIDIGQATKADVTIGDEHSLTLTCDDNIMPLVKTEVRDGVLRIWLEHKGSVNFKTDLQATIVTPNLDYVDASGASKLSASGVDTDSLEIQLSGASRMKVDGVANSVDIDLSGASKLSADRLEVEIARVDASGASSADVFVSDKLYADASGASKVRYAGNPGQVETNASGASSVKSH